jgi:hypothetical protein
LSELEPHARDCRLYDILSVTHGLPTELDPYLEILGFMVGERLTVVTALPARDLCAPWLLEQHPQLRDVQMPDFPTDRTGGEAAMDAWVDSLTPALGSRLPVSPLPPGRWASPSIMDVILDRKDPRKVWVVDPATLGSEG